MFLLGLDRESAPTFITDPLTRSFCSDANESVTAIVCPVELTVADSPKNEKQMRHFCKEVHSPLIDEADMLEAFKFRYDIHHTCRFPITSAL